MPCTHPGCNHCDSSEPQCTTCLASATKQCSRCVLVTYCSTTHQKIDWPKHKLVCATGRSYLSQAAPKSSTTTEAPIWTTLDPSSAYTLLMPTNIPKSERVGKLGYTADDVVHVCIKDPGSKEFQRKFEGFDGLTVCAMLVDAFALKKQYDYKETPEVLIPGTGGGTGHYGYFSWGEGDFYTYIQTLSQTPHLLPAWFSSSSHWFTLSRLFRHIKQLTVMSKTFAHIEADYGNTGVRLVRQLVRCGGCICESCWKGQGDALDGKPMIIGGVHISRSFAAAWQVGRRI